MMKIYGQLNYVSVYDFDHVLSKRGMTLAQGLGHSIKITEIKLKKMTYFGEITGPRSLLIQHYSGWQVLVDIFQKLTSSTLKEITAESSLW